MPPVEGYDTADWAAGATSEGSYSPIQLFTAEDEIKTGAATVLTGQALAVLTIVAFNVANKLVPWDPTATVAVVGGATSQTAPAAQSRPVGILSAAANTTSPSGDRMFPFYEGGCFNPDLLVWPASLDTFAERNAALRAAGAPFRVKRLL